MGVPSFYRWLASRYPKIVVDCVEEEPFFVGDEEVQVDASKPNPNGVEYDNLYLDMNGIIHPCFHPEDRPAPTTESEVFVIMFEYIDRLFNIVRPRKLLYMAIDGVAPRAKMNQQRSRRFRAAQDREELKKEEGRIREELAAQGMKLPPPKDETETFDSNVITPGTEFMFRLSVALQWYVHHRLNYDPAWRGLKVILSDANVPGEGEHKAMQYIREQRGRNGYDPNTRHCVYGLDADLIMLALATHEPHFRILREQVLPTQPQSKDQLTDKIKAQYEDQARKEAAAKAGASGAGAPQEESKPDVAKKPFQFLQVDVLREYLALDLRPFEPGYPVDPERLYDDFVFMCFFVGNDFLPHMPTLEIREGGVELMLHVYKRELPRMGYLADGPDVALDRVEHFIQAVGFYEEQIFSKRAKMLERQKYRMKDQRKGTSVSGAAPTKAYVADLQRQGQGQGHVGEKRAPRPWEQPAAAPPPPAPPVPAAAPPANSNRTAAQALRDKLISKRLPPAAAVAAAAAADMPPGLGDEGPGGDGTDAPQQGAAPGNECEPPRKVLKGEEGQVPVKDDTAAYWSSLAGPGPTEAAGSGGIPGLDFGAPAPDPAAPFPSPLSVAAGAPEAVAEAEEADTEVDALEEVDLPAALQKADDDIKKRLKETVTARADMFDQMVEDEKRVRLNEPGWKERYYSEKLGTTPETFESVRRAVAAAFVEGLVWVMRYYYDGVASWKWYYPFHYAPFASDLRDLASLRPKFDLGEPFKPFDQLMGVLPAGSCHCLPEPLRPLFTDPKSPILDFYPKTFVVDMNGKRFAWQGIALLPFIDEKRLTAETRRVETQLSDLERFRNTIRCESLYAHVSHPLGPDMLEASRRAQGSAGPVQPLPLDPERSGGMNGFLMACQGDPQPQRLSAPYSVGPDIVANQVVCAVYRLPPHKRHESKVPEGCMLIRHGITERDLPEEKPLWHEGGNRGGNRGGGGHGDRNGHGYGGHGQGYDGQAPPRTWQQPHDAQGPPGYGYPPAGPPGAYGRAPPPRHGGFGGPPPAAAPPYGYAYPPGPAAGPGYGRPPGPGAPYGVARRPPAYPPQQSFAAAAGRGAGAAYPYPGGYATAPPGYRMGPGGGYGAPPPGGPPGYGGGYGAAPPPAYGAYGAAPIGGGRPPLQGRPPVGPFPGAVPRVGFVGSNPFAPLQPIPYGEGGRGAPAAPVTRDPRALAGRGRGG